jgi:hypothetical protein
MIGFAILSRFEDVIAFNGTDGLVILSLYSLIYGYKGYSKLRSIKKKPRKGHRMMRGYGI